MQLRSDLADLPPYVPGKLIPGVLKLASNENPFGPSPKALQAIQGGLTGIHIYPDGACPDLRSALAQKWQCAPECLVFGNGSDEVFTLIAGAYLSTGDNAVTSEHTFSAYEFSVRLFGAQMRRAPQSHGKVDLDAFLMLVDARTKLIFICNPNNPTATYVTETELRNFMERLSPEVLVVLDEAYAEFADAPDFPRSRALLDIYPNLLISRTFSKVYGLASMRIGWAMARKEVIADLQVVRLPFNVGILSQLAATAALSDEEFVEQTLVNNHAQRLWLDQELTSRGFEVLPSQANFLAINVRQDCQKVFAAVRDQGVTIRPLSSFGLDSWVRITVGTPQQNRILIEAWDRAQHSLTLSS